MFTFKTERPTGRYRSFHPSVHEIKLNKKVCGMITDGKPHKVSFQTYKKDKLNSKNPNCPWEWITMKTPNFSDVGKAKLWVKERTGAILAFLKNNGKELYFQE